MHRQRTCSYPALRASFGELQEMQEKNVGTAIPLRRCPPMTLLSSGTEGLVQEHHTVMP